MSRSTALLISEDDSLTETMRRLIDRVAHLRFHRVQTIDQAYSLVQASDVGLLIPHLAQEADVAEVVRLLQSVMQSGRLIPAVIISDLPQGEPVRSLLRLG